MRESVAALALIRRTSGGETEYLTQWNNGWQALNFVGGHRRAEETFRACLCRELEEELGLRDGVDCQVEEHPLAHLEYTAFSRSAQEESLYVVELFSVQLNESAMARVNPAPENAWVNEAESRAGRTSAGRAVSATVPLLLSKAGLLPEG